MQGQNQIHPSQSESDPNTHHGISTQPIDLNPNPVVVTSRSFINSSFEGLRNIDHLFFEVSQENNNNANNTSYSIINEDEERVLLAQVTYDFLQVGSGADFPRTKVITGITILDSTGKILISTILHGRNLKVETDEVFGEGGDLRVLEMTNRVDERNKAQNGCWCDVVDPPPDILMKIDDQTYGRLDSGPNGCYYLSTITDNSDFKIISKHGCCCCSCCSIPFCCCTNCPVPFNIYEADDKPNSDNLLGQFHRSWRSHPGRFGFKFPASTDLVSKALLVVTGVYLNALYFEKHDCWGHVGLVGKICSLRWTVVSLVIIAISIAIIVVLTRMHRNKNKGQESDY